MWQEFFPDKKIVLEMERILKVSRGQEYSANNCNDTFDKTYKENMFQLWLGSNNGQNIVY